MPVKSKARAGSASAPSLKSSLSSAATHKSSETESPHDKDKTSDASGKTSEAVDKPKVNESFKERIMREAKKRKKELKKAKKAGGQQWDKFKNKLLFEAAPREFKSRSARARVAMPVDKLRKRIKEVAPADIRVPTEAGVAIAAALDYAASELLEVTCKACEMKQQRTITPRHIKLGVPQDESLAELFKGVTIPQGGTVPTYHPELAQGYRTSRKAPPRDVVPAARTAVGRPTRNKRKASSLAPSIDKKEDSSPSGSTSRKPSGGNSPSDITDKDETSPVPSDRVIDKEGAKEAKETSDQDSMDKMDRKPGSSKTELKGGSESDRKDASSPDDTSEKKDPSSPSTPKDGNEEKK